MAKNAPITSAAQAATFDAAVWLSQFEAVGGGFLATESQTSLCIACQGNTPENQGAAHAMLRALADDQRAAVIDHIRVSAEFSDRQPDLNVVCSQGFSEPAGISPPSSGSALGQSEGSHDMEMTHSFVPATANVELAGWDQLFAAYEAAKAAEDAYDSDVWTPAYKREKEFEALAGLEGYSSAAATNRKALREKCPGEFIPDDVNAEIERLQGVRIDLEYELVKTPAPDVDGLRWKLRYHRRISEDHVIDPEIFDAILAELDRLLERATTAAEGTSHSSPALGSPFNLHAEWDGARARYQAAEKAYSPYVDVHPAPEGVWEEVGKSYRDLLNTPAPDIGALRWKLKELLEDNPNATCALADFARLILGEQADCMLDDGQMLDGASTRNAYMAELDALDALGRSIDHLPESEGDRWEAWSIRLWGEIEALPATPENAKLKARAVWSIMGGDMDDLDDGNATNTRLVRQIITGLNDAGKAHPAVA